MALRTEGPALYEQLSVPPPSVPKPPHSPEHDGSYPEDQEHSDNEASVDSSLSIDKMASWITDGAAEPLVDLSGDEDEGVDGFGHEDTQHPVQILEPFDARFALLIGLGGTVMELCRPRV